MKDLFRRCCRGPTLEEYFAVDEYTEATLLHHPHIYITVQVNILIDNNVLRKTCHKLMKNCPLLQQEIVDTHALLVEYQEIIAPDPRDRLNELLDDLGDVPSVAQLASRDVDSVSISISTIIQKNIEDSQNNLFVLTHFSIPVFSIWAKPLKRMQDWMFAWHS